MWHQYKKLQFRNGNWNPQIRNKNEASLVLNWSWDSIFASRGFRPCTHLPTQNPCSSFKQFPLIRALLGHSNTLSLGCLIYNVRITHHRHPVRIIKVTYICAYVKILINCAILCWFRILVLFLTPGQIWEKFLLEKSRALLHFISLSSALFSYYCICLTERTIVAELLKVKDLRKKETGLCQSLRTRGELQGHVQ